MRFISKEGKVYWKNPEKQKLWAAKRKARTVKIRDIQKIGSERMFASRGLLQGKHQRDHKALSQAA